jgi:hypothetical protein
MGGNLGSQGTDQNGNRMVGIGQQINQLNSISSDRNENKESIYHNVFTPKQIDTPMSVMLSNQHRQHPLNARRNDNFTSNLGLNSPQINNNQASLMQTSEINQATLNNAQYMSTVGG